MKQNEAQPGIRVTWNGGTTADGAQLCGTILSPFNHPHLTILPEFALVAWDLDPGNYDVVALCSLDRQ